MDSREYSCSTYRLLNSSESKSALTCMILFAWRQKRQADVVNMQNWSPVVAVLASSRSALHAIVAGLLSVFVQLQLCEARERRVTGNQ